MGQDLRSSQPCTGILWTPCSRPCLLAFCFPNSNWTTFWLVGRTKTAGNSFVLGSTWQGRKGQGVRDGGLEALWTLHGPGFVEPHLGTGDGQEL